MNRRMLDSLVAALVMLVLALTMGTSSAVGKTYRCMVINDRLNTTYLWTYDPVGNAIAEAAPGDTLWVRGECFGTFEITKSLTLTGQRINGIVAAPTLNAASKGTVLHVSGSGVHVQVNSLVLRNGRDRFGPVEFGGGVWNDQAHVTLNDVEIAYGYADYGGGIFNNQGTVEISNTSIHDNRAEYGGGIYAGGGTLTVDASEISDNTAYHRGGGIAVNTEYPCRPIPCLPRPGAASVNLNDTTIHDNLTHQYGGAIFASGDTTVTLSGTSELTENRSWQYGGGVVFWGDLFSLADSATIHDNHSGGDGGGIYTGSGSLSRLSNCVPGTEGYPGVNVYNNMQGTQLDDIWPVPNHPPTAHSQSVSTSLNTSATITLNGGDQDGDTLAFAIVTAPAHGTLGTIGAVSCTGVPSICTADVTYTPAPGYTGADSFTFTANDGRYESTSNGISISVGP